MTGDSKMINQFAYLHSFIMILFIINSFLIGRMGMIVIPISKCFVRFK